MRKIFDYLTICDHDLDHFNEQVKTKIMNGWQPFGPAQMTSSPIVENGAPDKKGKVRLAFSQTLVKYEVAGT